MEIIAHSFAWLLKAITSIWHDRWIEPWSSFKWSNPFLFLRFYELVLLRKWLYFSPGKIIHEQIISDQQMNYRIYECSQIEIWNFEHLFLFLAKCNMVFQPKSRNPSKWSSLCAYALNHCSALTFSIIALTNYNHFGGFWKTLSRLRSRTCILIMWLRFQLIKLTSHKIKQNLRWGLNKTKNGFEHFH